MPLAVLWLNRRRPAKLEDRMALRLTGGGRRLAAEAASIARSKARACRAACSGTGSPAG
jgi:hypothetical protein